MVEEGMTIILDSGSATLLIAGARAKSNIAVITNSLLTCRFCYQKIKDLTLVVCGGAILRHKTHSMHGTVRNDRCTRHQRRCHVCRGGWH